MAVKKAAKEPAFEEELARLEALADQMEQNKLPLDELLSAYEEGMKLAAALQKRLEQARARLNEVREDSNGKLTVQPSDIAEEQGSLLDGLKDGDGDGRSL